MLRRKKNNQHDIAHVMYKKRLLIPKA